MQLIHYKDLKDINFNNIPNDNLWDFDNKTEDKMHRIHAYPAKFPAFITRNAIKNYEKDYRQNIKVIGDVFCGCGTTAYEARLNNKDFWGIDINPIAVLITKVKSNTYIDKTLIKYFEAIKIAFTENNTVSETEMQRVNERIHYWFESQQIRDLIILKRAIHSSFSWNSKYKSFFLVAFSNILKPTSKWLQKSIKPTIDPNKAVRNVWKVFEKQFKLMQKANIENYLSNDRKSKVKVKKANILDIRTTPKIDLLVSSPPYVTSYEYADLHQMSALWLDYTDDYKKLRQGTIGSIFHQTDFNQLRKSILPTGQEIVDELSDLDKKRAKDTAKYFLDMEKSIDKSYKLLKQNGQAMFIIGNTEYKSVLIDNAKHLVESMFKAGFQEIRATKRKISNKILTPYRTKEGKFSTQEKANRKIYAEEFLIRGLKL